MRNGMESAFGGMREGMHFAPDQSLAGGQNNNNNVRPELEQDQAEPSLEAKGVVIADESLKSIMENLLKANGLKSTTSLVMIEHHLRGNRAACNGLKDAIELAKSGSPVIMAGWQPIYSYAEDPNWHAALASPNVVFIRLPFQGPELIDKENEAKNSDRPFDQLAIDLLDVSKIDQLAKTLHHDLGNAIRNNDLLKLNELKAKIAEVYQSNQKANMTQEQIAKTIDVGNYDLEEVMAMLEEIIGNSGPSSELAGKYYPDLFIDVENTLIQPDGQPNQKVLDLIKRVEAEKQQPITIWTGGDTKECRKILRGLGLNFKLMSKHQARGMEVETAVDDLPEDELSKQYGVKIKNYIKVNDLK